MYAKQLGLQINKNNVAAQKIDSSMLKTFKMAIANFKVVDKLGKVQFF